MSEVKNEKNCCCDCSGGKTKERSEKEYKDLMNRLSRILQMNSQKIALDCSGSGTPILIVTGHSLVLMKAEMCLMMVLI